MTQAVILGVGARSSLGLDAAQTMFSLRVGLPAMREAPLVDEEGERITMCFLPTIDPHLTGPARGFELAHPALAEALRPISGFHKVPLRVRVALAVDEFVEATTAASLANRLDDPIKPVAAEFEQTISTRGAADAQRSHPARSRLKSPAPTCTVGPFVGWHSTSVTSQPDAP